MEWEKLGRVSARDKNNYRTTGHLYVKTIGEKFIYKFLNSEDKIEYVVAPAKDEKYNAYVAFADGDYYLNVPLW